jgi:hypothetical protein
MFFFVYLRLGVCVVCAYVFVCGYMCLYVCVLAGVHMCPSVDRCVCAFTCDCASVVCVCVCIRVWIYL